jgi:hypothetical protein
MVELPGTGGKIAIVPVDKPAKTIHLVDDLAVRGNAEHREPIRSHPAMDHAQRDSECRPEVREITGGMRGRRRLPVRQLADLVDLLGSGVELRQEGFVRFTLIGERRAEVDQSLCLGEVDADEITRGLDAEDLVETLPAQVRHDGVEALAPPQLPPRDVDDLGNMMHVVHRSSFASVLSS